MCERRTNRNVLSDQSKPLSSRIASFEHANFWLNSHQVRAHFCAFMLASACLCACVRSCVRFYVCKLCAHNLYAQLCFIGIHTLHQPWPRLVQTFLRACLGVPSDCLPPLYERLHAGWPYRQEASPASLARLHLIIACDCGSPLN